MTMTSVWDRTSAWSGVVYAPDVPLAERRPFNREARLPLSSGYSGYQRACRRFRKRWQGRALLLDDARVVTPRDISVWRVQESCGQVWEAGRSLAGVLDLGELEYRLSDELWMCAQLAHEAAKLFRETYDTSAARKVLEDQIAERQRRLAMLRDEYTALYAEGGADPAAVSDTVREALLRAQSLGEHRPIDDAVMWTQSLREIVVEYQASETEQRVTGAGVPHSAAGESTQFVSDR
ncbi:hypothetical protein [Streptomyces sp. NPDC048442]|uniref:hypothetical protein n=1 Tax=Streptomyces sp. NPDC048442 TaxID=3154823 RepID=UPI0034467E72